MKKIITLSSKAVSDWLQIQRFLGVVPDAWPGVLTTTAIKDRLGIVPEPISTEIDERSASNIASLDPKAQGPFRRFLVAAKRIAHDMGTEAIIIGGQRSWEEQDSLYASSRPPNKGQWRTNARGGESNHNFGIAADFGIFRDEIYLDNAEPKTARAVYKAIAKAAPEHGIDWGGNWRTATDMPHFEIATGLSTRQKRDRYKRTGSVL